MTFVPGTPKSPIALRDTLHEHNLLPRGQEIEVDVPEAETVNVVLKPGQISLHHVMLVHGSGPNESDDRRIGFAIRYVPTHVKQVKMRDSAMLVRGVDDYGNFDYEEPPKGDADAAALAQHKAAMDRQVAVLYSGTDHKQMRD